MTTDVAFLRFALLFIRTSVSPSVCLFVYLFIHVSISMSLFPSVSVFTYLLGHNRSFILITIQCVYFVRNLSRNSITNLPEGLFAKADKIHTMWVIADTKQIEKEKKLWYVSIWFEIGVNSIYLYLHQFAFNSTCDTRVKQTSNFFGLLSSFHSSPFLLTHYFVYFYYNQQSFLQPHYHAARESVC